MNETTVVNLLQDLIRIPSVNIDMSPSHGHTEQACAEFVGDFLHSCGAKVHFDEVESGRPNVIGSFPTRGGGPRMVFAPHLDTVSIEGMTIEPFAGEVRDGKIWGRGASDTKGSMAAMLWALSQHRDSFADMTAEVSFVGLMGEEAGQPGSKHFGARYAADYDFAIVGEPTSLDIVHAHKGSCWLEIVTKGRACHGSEPEKGENAILKMARWLPNLVKALEERFASFRDPFLGVPTVSVGLIDGGSSPNIVAASCRVTLDLRLTPALLAAGSAEDHVRAALRDLGVVESVEIIPSPTAPPLSEDPEQEWIQKLCKNGASCVSAPWFCDAGWLVEAGIPSIACGPGSIAQAHTKDEFISVEDLEAGGDFFLRYLQSLD